MNICIEDLISDEGVCVQGPRVVSGLRVVHFVLPITQTQIFAELLTLPSPLSIFTDIL